MADSSELNLLTDTMATLLPVTLLELNAWSLLHTNRLFGVQILCSWLDICQGLHVEFLCLLLFTSFYIVTVYQVELKTDLAYI